MSVLEKKKSSLADCQLSFLKWSLNQTFKLWNHESVKISKNMTNMFKQQYFFFFPDVCCWSTWRPSQSPAEEHKSNLFYGSLRQMICLCFFKHLIPKWYYRYTSRAKYIKRECERVFVCVNYRLESHSCSSGHSLGILNKSTTENSRKK